MITDFPTNTYRATPVQALAALLAVVVVGGLPVVAAHALQPPTSSPASSRLEDCIVDQFAAQGVPIISDRALKTGALTGELEAGNNLIVRFRGTNEAYLQLASAGGQDSIPSRDAASSYGQAQSLATAINASCLHP